MKLFWATLITVENNEGQKKIIKNKMEPTRRSVIIADAKKTLHFAIRLSFNFKASRTKVQILKVTWYDL